MIYAADSVRLNKSNLKNRIPYWTSPIAVPSQSHILITIPVTAA